MSFLRSAVGRRDDMPSRDELALPLPGWTPPAPTLALTMNGRTKLRLQQKAKPYAAGKPF